MDFFYNFISANEVCLLLYSGFSPQIGDESGFLCTNQKDCETKSQSINDHCVLLISFLLCMCVRESWCECGCAGYGVNQPHDCRI